MPKLTADEVTTYGHKRIFLQPGGARPDKPTKYGGVDTQYMEISGVSAPVAGGINPINVHDPYNRKRYKLIGRTIDAPDLDSATLTVYEKHGAIPWAWFREIGCFNLYVTTGTCKNPSDFLGGWTDFIEIYSSALVTDRDMGDRHMFDSDDATTIELGLTLAEIYAVGSINLGEAAATEVTTDVIDVTFAGDTACDVCTPRTGAERVYAVTKGDLTTTPGNVVYSLNGGRTWATSAVTGLVATDVVTAIRVMGNSLIVVTANGTATTTGSIFVATLSDAGVPSGWTEVSTGFVATGEPRDMAVVSASEAYLAGDAGYIYKLTTAASGVSVLTSGGASDLNRIRATGTTVVAVGQNGLVQVSQNRGVTFAAATVPVAANLTAVEVLDNNRFWVGTTAGAVYYTLDGGVSWTQLTIAGATAIQDIVFPTQEVGYIAYSASSTMKILTTWDGGASWTASGPRLLNTPTATRANRIATPRSEDGTTAANTLAIGGLSGGGTDGIVLIGAAARI